jgi:molybdopterin-binding protein
MERAKERVLTAGQAARELGISIDTLRRWDRQGRIRTGRDAANRRTVAASEIARLRAEPGAGSSARNRLTGRVASVRIEGLLAQVELEIAGPGRIVAVITRDAAEELALRAGGTATAVIKATSVMVER